MATLAEITRGKSPAQLAIIKRELTTRLQSMTPERRTIALREIAGIPELGNLFGEPASPTTPRATIKPQVQPSFGQRAATSFAQGVTNLPWFGTQAKFLQGMGAGLGKAFEFTERPEVERWLRPGVSGGAILWAPKYGFEGGKPTPETLKAYTEFAKEHPEIKNPADFFKAMWDIQPMYGTKSTMGKQYEEKVPLGARIATEAAIEAPMWIGGGKALGTIPQLARLSKPARAILGIEKSRPSAAQMKQFGTTARTLIGKGPKAAPIAKGTVLRPGVVDDITAKLKEWRATFKEQKALRGEEFSKRFEEYGQLTDDWLTKHPKDMDGARNYATGVLKGKYPEAKWEMLDITKDQMNELRLFGRQNMLETAKDYDRIGAAIIEADRHNLDDALIRVFVGQTDDVTGQLVRKAPREFEIKLFERAFGADFTNTLMSLKKSMSGKAWNNFLDAANFPRAVLASFDVSAPFRQGMVLFARHPIEGFRSMKTMFSALKSEVNAQLIDDAIFARPGTKRGLEYGLDLVRRARQQVGKGLKAMAGREEPYMSRFAGKIPGIKASERAYVTFLNDLRSRVWEGYLPILDNMKVNAAKQLGLATDDIARAAANKSIQQIDDAYRGMASLINIATGRGEVGKMRQFMPILNNLMFSPRLALSRLQLPAKLFSQNPIVRKEAWKMMAAFSGLNVAILGGLKLAGFEVGLDPRSAEFGKVKIGNTRLDLWAGFIQFARFFTQVSTAQRKIASGEIVDVNRADIVQNFAQTKLAPMAGFLWDLLEGQTYMGDDVLPSNKEEALKQIRNRLAPLFMQDVWDAVEDSGPEGALVASPGAFGVGVSTYPPPEDIEFQKKTLAIKQRNTENLDYISSLSDEKSPNYIASSKDRADVREQYYLNNPRFYDDQSRIAALNKGAPDGIVEDYVQYRQLTQIHSGNSLEAKLFRIEHPEFNSWGQSIEGFEWNKINVPRGMEKAIPIIRQYISIEDSIWNKYPPQIRQIAEQIKELEKTDERQARQLQRQYPQILAIRREIALTKRNAERQFPWLQDAIAIIRSS